jgi:uncharacterized protein YqcC (DUF446 family)
MAEPTDPAASRTDAARPAADAFVQALRGGDVEAMKRAATRRSIDLGRVPPARPKPSPTLSCMLFKTYVEPDGSVVFDYITHDHQARPTSFRMALRVVIEDGSRKVDVMSLDEINAMDAAHRAPQRELDRQRAEAAAVVVYRRELPTPEQREQELIAAEKASIAEDIMIGLRQPEPPERPKPMTDDEKYATAAKLFDAVEAEMRKLGAWDIQQPTPEQVANGGAFGGATMAFEQWIRWVFAPRVREIIATRGRFPYSSQVGSYAVREFDGRRDTGGLVSALMAFDDFIIEAGRR